MVADNDPAKAEGEAVAGVVNSMSNILSDDSARQKLLLYAKATDGDFGAALDLARVYKDEGDYQQAQNFYQWVWENTQNTTALVGLADCARAVGELFQSHVYLSQAVEEFSDGEAMLRLAALSP